VVNTADVDLDIDVNVNVNTTFDAFFDPDRRAGGGPERDRATAHRESSVMRAGEVNLDGGVPVQVHVEVDVRVDA